MNTFSTALNGLKFGEMWRRTIWPDTTYLTLHKEGADPLTQVVSIVHVDAGGSMPAVLQEADILADDWEKVLPKKQVLP